MVPTSGTVVHGDAHLNKVIWNGARVAALLDFEWARLGPPDLELQPLLASHGDVLRSLIKAYPAIVADAQVVDRLLALQPERDAARPARQGAAARKR
jgi:aminoglycoside phosphotransferase (APT) family kinase protein